MSDELPHRRFSDDDENFGSLLDELVTIKERHVVQTLEWYKRHARRPMLLFRTSGVLLILLSVSIPLMSVSDGFWRDDALPVVALAIAALASLNSFFQWHSSWQNYRQTQFALEYLISKWEVAIAVARRLSDPTKAAEAAIAATERLLDEARLATETKTLAYFSQVRMPELPGGGT